MQEFIGRLGREGYWNVEIKIYWAGFHVALRPRRRDDLLGTGTEWEGDRVIGSTAETARKRPERP